MKKLLYFLIVLNIPSALFSASKVVVENAPLRVIGENTATPARLADIYKSTFAHKPTFAQRIKEQHRQNIQARKDALAPFYLKNNPQTHLPIPKRGDVSTKEIKALNKRNKDFSAQDPVVFAVPRFNNAVYHARNALSAIKAPFQVTKREITNSRLANAFKTIVDQAKTSGSTIAEGARNAGRKITDGIQNIKSKFQKKSGTLNDKNKDDANDTLIVQDVYSHTPQATKPLRYSQLESKPSPYNNDIEAAAGPKKDALFDENQVIKQQDGTFKFADNSNIPEGYQLRKTKGGKYGLVENPKPKPRPTNNPQATTTKSSLEQKSTTQKEEPLSVNSENYTWRTSPEDPSIQLRVLKKDAQPGKSDYSEYYNINNPIPSRRNSAADTIDQ